MKLNNKKDTKAKGTRSVENPEARQEFIPLF